MKGKIDLLKLGSLICGYIAFACFLFESFRKGWQDLGILEGICIICIFICLFFKTLEFIREGRKNIERKDL